MRAFCGSYISGATPWRPHWIIREDRCPFAPPHEHENITELSLCSLERRCQSRPRQWATQHDMMPPVLPPTYAEPLSWAVLVALETSEGATSRRCNYDPYSATNDHCTHSSRLEYATKKNVGSKRDEYGNCRRSDGC